MSYPPAVAVASMPSHQLLLFAPETIMQMNQSQANVTVTHRPLAIARQDLPGLVSGHFGLIFQAINFAIICELVDIFGTGTNIVNIICFVKQGFKDPVNISLLGLAISDLGCLLTLVWHNICFNPLFHQADLPFDPIEMTYLTGGWPHVAFTRVTSCITAFITIERCLCITMPLKVKSIITPKRVVIIIVTIFIVLMSSIAPVFYSNRIGWKFFPERNKTLLGLVYTSDRDQVEKVSITINNIFIPFGAFFTVIISTIILVVKLKEKTKWRKKSTAAGKSDTLSARDQKVANMVVMISSLFIICFIPVSVIFIGMTVEPELAINGRYRNTFCIVFSISYILESTNSAMNIFIYYNMSSRYRAVFRQTFCRDITVGQSSGEPEI